MNVVVTGSTENQRFVLASRHDFYPCRFLSPIIFLKVFQGPNMMQLDVIRGPAVLTGLSQESLFQL